MKTGVQSLYNTFVDKSAPGLVGSSIGFFGINPGIVPLATTRYSPHKIRLPSWSTASIRKVGCWLGA